MRRSSNSVIQLVAVAMLLLVFAGCQSGNRGIVGKWKVTSDTSELVWEFAPGGAVSSGDMHGRYSFGDQNRIKIQTPFATFVYQMEISGDRMIWKAPNGSKTELTRVN